MHHVLKNVTSHFVFCNQQLCNKNLMLKHDIVAVISKKVPNFLPIQLTAWHTILTHFQPTQPIQMKGNLSLHYFINKELFQS